MRFFACLSIPAPLRQPPRGGWAEAGLGGRKLLSCRARGAGYDIQRECRRKYVKSSLYLFGGTEVAAEGHEGSELQRARRWLLPPTWDY